ncbi:MAG: hypothetical protein K2W95_05680 [Candidatus Obscuribacterales bacterium]|nr:hypothetical protein [Candidatus Obscuribacterales bacterium]
MRKELLATRCGFSISPLRLISQMVRGISTFAYERVFPGAHFASCAISRDADSTDFCLAATKVRGPIPRPGTCPKPDFSKFIDLFLINDPEK